MSNGIPTLTTRQVSCDELALNMRDTLARKNMNLIWGNGFIFQSENENITSAFRKIDKNNRLLNLFAFCERELSLNGKVIITINKTKGGEYMLGMGIPYYFNGVGRTFINEELAVVYQRFKLDQTNFIIKSTYDREKCVNEIFDGEGKMLILSAQIDIMNKYKIERVWKHNLGFVPVREIVNIPVFFYQFDNGDYIKYSDWFPARQFESVMYEAYKNLIKELNICHSRIGIEGASQQLIADMKKQLTINGEYIDLSDVVIETDVGGKIFAIPGVGDFTKYTNTMNSIMDFYFKFSNTSRFSDGGGAQKTSSEANATKDNLTETINSKIQFRQKQYSQLLNLLLAAYGVVDADKDEYDFIFKINGNMEHNEAAMVDNVVKQVNLGTMSIEEGIQFLRNVSKDESKKIYEEIKNFNETNEIMTSNSMGMQQDDFDVDTQGGAPTKGDNDGKDKD